MKYKVDAWNNFCRVFLIPEKYPEDYCFGGGHAVNFQMVDWFYPVSGLGQPAVPKEVWIKEVGEIEVIEITHDDFRVSIIPFLAGKSYVRQGREYLVLCDFGAAIRFNSEGLSNDL
jgi:hypothetical protein